MLELIAGRARVRSGRLRVLGGNPIDELVRGQLALVTLSPPLPDALRVGEVLAVAASLRGEPPIDPLGRLATLGLEALVARPARTLSPEETRAVALVEALTSTRVRVMLLEEPLAGLDSRVTTRLPDLLRARARGGCTVLVATASVRDASDLADDHVLLRGGMVAGRAGSLDELAGFSPEGARIRVVTTDARALLAAVAREEAVEAVGRRDASVVVRGRDTVALAAAVGRAIVAGSVSVTELRVELPSMDEARAASAGVAAATYEAAYSRTRAALVPPSESKP